MCLLIHIQTDVICGILVAIVAQVFAAEPIALILRFIESRQSTVDIKINFGVPRQAEADRGVISNFTSSHGDSLLSQSAVFASDIGVSPSSVLPVAARLLSELLDECLDS